MFRELETQDPFDAGDGWDARRMLDLLGRRWRTILVCGLAALIPALGTVAWIPAVYRATATVAVQSPAEVFSFGEEVLPDQPRGRRASLAPELAVIRADRILGQVVDRLPELETSTSTWSHVIASTGWSAEKPTAQAVRRARLDALRESIDLEELGGGTVLAISSASYEPGGAAALANAIAESFIRYKADERRDAARRAVAWLSERSNELRYEIAQREQALSSLVARTGVAPLPEGDDPGARSSLSAQLHATRLELLTVEQQLAHLGTSVPASPAEREHHDALRRRHEDARSELENARLRYTPTHPEVQRLEIVVLELGHEVARMPVVASPEEIEGRRREQEDLHARRVQLTSRVSVLRRALDSQAAPGDSLQQAQLEYERLERDVAIDRQLLEVLMRRMNETVLTAATDAASASILDFAVEPLEPASPNRRKAVVLSLILSLAFGLGLAFLRELLDRRVYEPGRALEILGAPLLAMIPAVSRNGPAERQSVGSYDSAAAESYRNLRTSLQFSSGSGRLGVLLITSGVAGEGKTTVSANLAASFAQAGRSVVLVDADLRRPRVNQVFGLDRAPGLAELLAGTGVVDETIQRVADGGFDVIPSGEIPGNPAELLASPLLDLLLSRLKARYDTVLIDSPVLLAVADPLLLASRVDATLLVVKPGTLERAAYERMRHLLQTASARVLGVAVNQVQKTEQSGYPSYLESPYIGASTRRATKPEDEPLVEPS